ncbi:PDZ domain-containing protein, partial [Bacillus sp. 'calajunan']
FLHTDVYVFLISSIFVGYLRMLRERKDFSFNVYDIWFELRTSLFAGVGYGLIVSILTIGRGLVVSKASLWVILLWSLLFGLTAMYRYLSAAYTFS